MCPRLRPDCSCVKSIAGFEFYPPRHRITHVTIARRHAGALLWDNLAALNPETIGIGAFARQFVKCLEIADRSRVCLRSDGNGGNKSRLLVFVDVNGTIVKAHPYLDITQVRYRPILYRHAGRLIARFAGARREKGQSRAKSQPKEGPKPIGEEHFHNETGKFTPSQAMSESSL